MMSTLSPVHVWPAMRGKCVLSILITVSLTPVKMEAAVK